MWPWATWCAWPCFNMGNWTRWFPESLPTSATLWSCDLRNYFLLQHSKNHARELGGVWVPGSGRAGLCTRDSSHPARAAAGSPISNPGHWTSSWGRPKQLSAHRWSWLSGAHSQAHGYRVAWSVDHAGSQLKASPWGWGTAKAMAAPHFLGACPQCHHKEGVAHSCAGSELSPSTNDTSICEICEIS